MKNAIKSRLALFLAAAGLFPLLTQAGGNSTSSHEETVAFGSQLLHINDSCLSVEGTLASGEFFSGLQRKAKDGRIEYSKHGEKVDEYPDSLATSIRISGDPCAAAAPTWPSPFNGKSYAVRFEVEWKDGMSLRPATLAAGAAQCEGYASVPVPHRNYTIPAISCHIAIDGKGVPLSNHLIVSVYGADGQRLTRISAAP